MDRMELLQELSTDEAKCPVCGAPNKCAIEAGKSASTCWCMNYPPVDRKGVTGACLCERCFKLANNK